MKNIILAAGHDAVRFGAQVGKTKEFFLAKKVIDSVFDLYRGIGGAPFHLAVITLGKESLSEKIKTINKIYYVDLAIELHWNVFIDPAVRGSEAFYMKGDDAAWLAAESYCKTFQQVSGVPTRGAKPDDQSQHSRLAWCRDIKCPSILIENEFLTADGFQEDYYYHLSVVAMIQFLASFSRR